ncbi:MAG: hypothetical protein PHY09_04435 [Desulfuromonadaceae bacterium]|nr:hypothetical protein [Desulfuromonadaceae bacterium]MDD5105707.1 hypothetical protein [Desulfuromonadaceae bacterium]
MVAAGKLVPITRKSKKSLLPFKNRGGEIFYSEQAFRFVKPAGASRCSDIVPAEATSSGAFGEFAKADLGVIIHNCIGERTFLAQS